jgi:pyruvate dehydrogenase E2 component (dihydrolipoamide acetyltransferase)
MRASIARRMTESKREAPHFYLNAVVDMEAAHRLREEMRASETVAAIVTFNHMIVKAAADALRAHPELNARFAGDAVDILDGVHVGIATAVPDGLIVPVIHDADRKSLVEIATAARALAEKARSRTFSGDELSGATFTVSNLGMYGVESFAAVINPPQAAILAVGAVAVRPFVRDGALVAAHTVVLTLSCDHRAVDGARGAEFLRDVGIRLENPARLLFPASTPDA